MYTKIILTICFIFLSTISTLHSGTIDPAIPDKEYVEFGKQFQCVAKICGKYKDGTLFCASAVVIDSNHILTAAHVVKGHDTCYITLEDKQFPLSKIILHKDFETGGFGHADIAIGYSITEFKLEKYPTMYDKDDEVGKECTMAGYGLTGTFINGAIISDNKKRAGSNKIDYIDKNLLICSPSKKDEVGYTNLEFLIGSGDSGGGLFIDSKLAGINSCVMVIGKNKSPKSRYGEESGHTRISKFRDWINKNKTIK